MSEPTTAEHAASMAFEVAAGALGVHVVRSIWFAPEEPRWLTRERLGAMLAMADSGWLIVAREPDLRLLRMTALPMQLPPGRVLVVQLVDLDPPFTDTVLSRRLLGPYRQLLQALRPTLSAHSTALSAPVEELFIPGAPSAPAPMSEPEDAGQTRSRRPRSGSAARRAARPASDIVRRLPAIEFDETVRAGEKRKLVLQLSDLIPPQGLARAIEVSLPAGAESVTLSVTLSAPGFSVSPKAERKLVVGREFDARRERANFTLTALEPKKGRAARREIRADLWLGNAALGGATHWTTVVPKTFAGAARPPGKSRTFALDLRDPGRTCGLVLLVEGADEAGSPPFRLRLRLQVPGAEQFESLPVGTLQLTRRQLSQLLNQKLRSFAKTPAADAPAGAMDEWRESLLGHLSDIGKLLWQHLPDKLRQEYFKLHDAGHGEISIWVHSDEMLIPWELIVPHRQGKQLPALGAAHVMGRWRPGLSLRPRPQGTLLSRAAIANPRYSDGSALLWSALEARALRAAHPLFELQSRMDEQAMRKLLQRTDVQLLHFTGHGAYTKNADLSTLLLEGGGSVDATSFIGSPLLGQANAFVYLNACEVGRSGVSMGRMGGFAARCVESGCNGVVAPYWAISDVSAHDFAVSFYAKVAGGTSIGEALKELRNERASDPTYQAFSYLGDPFARLQFS